MEHSRYLLVLTLIAVGIFVLNFFDLDDINNKVKGICHATICDCERNEQTAQSKYTGCPSVPLNIKQENNLGTESSQKTLVYVLRSLRRAFRYARSSKTQNEIRNSIRQLEKALGNDERNSYVKENKEEDKITATKEVLNDNGEVCRDFWQGFHVGFPFFHQGINTQPCSQSRPLQLLVSIVLNFVNEIRIDDFKPIMEDILASKYKDLEFLIALSSEISEENKLLLNKLPNSKRVDIALGSKLPAVLNILAKSTDKKYVVVTRDLERFNNFAKPERLIRMLSYKKADVASAASRNASGHWKYGCYQSKLIAYQYRLVEGYDMSYNSCMYCDYASGPFSIYREKLISLTQVNVNKAFENEAFYLNIFHQIKVRNEIVLACVDVMYHNRKMPFVGLTKGALIPFIRNYKINEVETPNELYKFSCEEAETNCAAFRKRGTILPRCCYRQLTECLGFMARQFAKHNIYYELDSGSTLGSVKVDETLPWERDHDLNLHMSNISKVMTLQSTFKQAGYDLIQTQKVGLASCCPDYSNTKKHCWHNCGYIALKCPNWRIELWGRRALSCDIWQKLSVKTMTRSLVGKDFVQTHASPGSYSAGKYGMNVLKHAEHWGVLGLSGGNQVYPAGSWMDCGFGDKNFHGCANQYLPDGNLQFKEVWI